MQELAHLSVKQFTEAWRALCSAAPDYAFHKEAGVQYVFSRLPLIFFNAVILTGNDLSAADLQQQAKRAAEHASRMNCPWMLMTTDSAVAPGVDVVGALDAAGFAHLMPLTGMAADGVAPPDGIPEGLAISTPEDDASCAAILDVNSKAYGMSLEAGLPVWGTRNFWKKHSVSLGCVDGQPVCTAAVLKVDGYRYVALVATDPAFQRRKYADAVMRHALESSRQTRGDLPTFLHATEAGRPVYERMGHRALARHGVFAPKQFLAAH